jgi:hypothetical protein
MIAATTFSIPTDTGINIVVDLPLDAVLESLDPFSGSAARAHYERVRPSRGW